MLEPAVCHSGLPQAEAIPVAECLFHVVSMSVKEALVALPGWVLAPAAGRDRAV